MLQRRPISPSAHASVTENQPFMLMSHLYSNDPETSTLGPNVEPVENDNGLRDNVLWQPEQNTCSLRELGAGEAKRALEVCGYAIELRTRGGELIDCGQRV